MEAYSRMLFDLYYQSTRKPVDQFQEWVFERAKDLMSFDSGFWGTGTPDGDSAITHEIHLYKQPLSMTERWFQYKELDNDHYQESAANSGITINRNYESLYLREMHEKFWSVFNVNNFLATYVFDPAIYVYHAISFYRADPQSVFSEEERKLKQCLVPHMIEARRINLLRHMVDAGGLGLGADLNSCIADIEGYIHTANQEIPGFLRMEWADWSPPRLPDALRSACAAKQTFSGKRIVVSITPVNELYLLRFRERHAFDDLTGMEKEVAFHASQGHSYKEIALSLDLSPNTVRNHLASVYSKLGIDNKVSLSHIVQENRP